jgi:hypothetical protein
MIMTLGAVWEPVGLGDALITCNYGMSIIVWRLDNRFIPRGLKNVVSRCLHERPRLLLYMIEPG